MPTAKLIIDNSANALPRELNRLAGTTVADHRDLSEKFSVADLGVPVGRAGDVWDLAYEAVRETPGQFFEPDFPSGFRADTGAPSGTPELAAAPDAPHPHDQIAGDIKGPGFGWHRLDNYAQLEDARTDADAGDPAGVRIAICDVGFDLDHSTYPKDRVEHARNFLSDAAPDNVRDRNIKGFLKNPGHGTATIALLAARSRPISSRLKPFRRAAFWVPPRKPKSSLCASRRLSFSLKPPPLWRRSNISSRSRTRASTLTWFR